MELIVNKEREELLRGNAKWIELAGRQFNELDAENTMWTYAESPFSAPPRFDVENILELCNVRRQAAEDDLWLLQTDPAYLRSIITRFRNSTLYQRFDGKDAKHILVIMTLCSVRRMLIWSWASRVSRSL